MENRVITASRSLSDGVDFFPLIHKEVFYSQCNSLISLQWQYFLVIQSDVLCTFVCKLK